MHPHRVAESKSLLAQWVRWPHSARFPLYTAYLESLANGERLSAVHRYLRPLIAELAAADRATRWLFVDRLCRSVDYRCRKAGTSPVPGIPHDLLEKVVIPTLGEQRHLHPEDPYVLVWMAMLPVRQANLDLPNPLQLLEQAHRLDSADEFVIERLVEERLHWIQFSCHHLPSSLLAPARSILGDIEQLVELASGLREDQQRFFAERAAWYQAEVERFVATCGDNDAT